MTSSDDPTRPTAGDDAKRAGERLETPATDRRSATAPGDVGRTDADRRDPDRRGTDRPRKDDPAADVPDTSSGGKTAGMWIGLILGAIILVLLLIFVIQNNVTAGFQYFGAQFDLPLGVAMLLAAIAGALVMALVGSVRMLQMSLTIRKLRKQQERIHRATR
jgi:uncharacterized integral membrane protein